MNNTLPINKVICGDAIEQLKIFPDNYFDSIVTDPPAGISFMGKQWDADKGGRNAWINWLSNIFIEAKRVIKPGGHALVWALPRTSHWTAMALEDAGFEVRDCIYHVFGSGFPKSMNIGKAIDDKLGIEREVLGVSPNWRESKRNREQFGSMEVRGKNAGLLTEATSMEAKQWSGYGTALKPAVECWWLVRKPISENTIAENVLKWGVGGINIDGCRIESGTEHMRGNVGAKVTESDWKNHTGFAKPFKATDSRLGRFPANLIHDGSDEVMTEFAKDGVSKSIPHTHNHKKDTIIYGNGKGLGIRKSDSQFADSGSPARFFYCAKPSRSERDNGLNQSIGVKRETPMAGRGQGGLKCELCGKWKNSGSPCICITPKFIEVKFDSKPNKNNHPTVKSQALMEYLIKLITHPNSIGLDMFAGSGSTLIAYKKLGHRYIGIEIDPDYCKIAEQRLIADLNGNRSLDVYKNHEPKLSIMRTEVL